MVLIVSNEADLTTNDVIDWLLYYNIPFLCVKYWHYGKITTVQPSPIPPLMLLSLAVLIVTICLVVKVSTIFFLFSFTFLVLNVNK